MKITEKYGLTKQTDFFDAELEYDNKLFIDPYSLIKENDDFIKECAENVRNYFDQLLSAAINEDDKLGENLVRHLHENNETRLGYCSNKIQGKGFGEEKGKKIFQIIKKSEAVKTGLIKDIFDTSLMINNVGPDMISDLITSISFLQLVAYTQYECRKNNIETENVNINRVIWDANRNKWVYIKELELPSHKGKAILFVPNSIVKSDNIISYKTFYNEVMMPFYEDYAIKNPQLGLIKVLKNGKCKPIKKKIRDKFPCYKQSVRSFIKENPKTYQSYKKHKGI